MILNPCNNFTIRTNSRTHLLLSMLSPIQLQAGFDAQLLLCKIHEERKDYDLAIKACNIAIQSKPDIGDPYEVKALSLVMRSETPGKRRK